MTPSTASSPHVARTRNSAEIPREAARATRGARRRGPPNAPPASTGLRLVAPLSASVLDAGTAFRWTRLGVAMTYATPEVEGSLSFEQTVTGAGGLVPVASVFRIVMRTSRWPF